MVLVEIFDEDYVLLIVTVPPFVSSFEIGVWVIRAPNAAARWESPEFSTCEDGTAKPGSHHAMFNYGQ